MTRMIESDRYQEAKRIHIENVKNPLQQWCYIYKNLTPSYTDH